ncbi:MAG TPA: tail fiber domain-containing protein [Stellaceae bacterium]|nr:tail fiber domain-containing protein [Stellaceae bacterium]
MDTTDLSLVTLLQLPDAGALTGSEYVHLVQGADPPADVKCTLNYLGASIGTGLIYVTGLSNQYPSMAIGQLVSWPMAWRGTVCGYEAASGGFSTDTNLQQVPAVTPDLVAAGAPWELPDHVAAFGERAGRGAWSYSGTFLGQQAGYFAIGYAPVLVGRWAGYGALGAQLNALGYEAGAFSDGGYDAGATTLAAAISSTTTGAVAVANAAPWAPATLGYANGTLFFRIDQEVIEGRYIDATHISLDGRGVNGSTAEAHEASAPVLRFLPSAQNNFVGWQAGKYLWGGNNDLHGHQAGYQSSIHDSAGLGYHSLYVSTGYNHVGIGSRANAAVAGHDNVAIGAGATTQVLGTPFTVTTGPGNRNFDIANVGGAPSQNIRIPAGTGAANGWSSGQTVNLLWSWSGSLAPVHLESLNTAYLFTFYEDGGGNEFLLPSKQVWYWNGSATADSNPGDRNAPVGGDDVASWASPENPTVTLYQPVGVATFTPIVGVAEATAIGSAAAATAQNALALGANANASQTNATAVGEAAAASADHASSFGANAAAGASYAQAIGYAASVTGASSVAVGANVSVGGIESVGIGKSASASGGDAVAIGATASASGLDSTAVGFGASAGFTNSTAIGCQAAATNSNSVVLGNSAVTHIYAAVTAITAISDRRRKKEVRDLDLGLDFIARLRPVSYRFRNGDETLRYGFIAQDVTRALPRPVGERIADGDRGFALVERDNDGDGTYRLNYGELIAPLVRAVQELTDDVTKLRQRVASLEAAP